ncbi:hypothetical protein HGRIS_011859 [Hohenbuehelia grisea]|uniref:Uncharacterized protein n=1 Tax=Hohenbuehelia grisea TaxID=104357 RepID=A0ABR3JXT6_9AGAR
MSPDSQDLGGSFAFVSPEVSKVLDSSTYSESKTVPEQIADLMSGGINSQEVEINMAEAIVVEFKEEFRLLAHQVVARRWMAERENFRAGRRGGILADDMGLGKTIMILVRILDGRRSMPPQLNGWAPVTLYILSSLRFSTNTDPGFDEMRSSIVCPASILQQWRTEINRFCTKKLRVIVHHGASRTTNPQDLRDADVVITTYDILKSEHLNYSTTTSNEELSFVAPVPKKATVKQALYHVNWYRVVLDEAHYIKDSKTRRATACFALTTLFKWVMTGTPIHNSVLDLYSPFHFLQLKPFSDWEEELEELIGDKANNWECAFVKIMWMRQALLVKKDQLDTWYPPADDPSSQQSAEVVYSAKIRKMLELLQDISHRDEKTIIYSSFTTMLDIAGSALEETGTKFVRYDGTMTIAQRSHSVDEIHTNAETRCILVSLMTGSIGLNLTACNNIILLDSHWNPFVEEQAFDRAHRIGQERPVNIYKLTIEFTIENRILQVQDRKRAFAREALKGNKVKGLSLTTEETLAFFRPGGTSLAF